MYVAISNWNEKCDQYLQLWLVLNGVIQLILLVPAVISTCRSFHGRFPVLRSPLDEKLRMRI